HPTNGAEFQRRSAPASIKPRRPAVKPGGTARPAAGLFVVVTLRCRPVEELFDEPAVAAGDEEAIGLAPSRLHLHEPPRLGAGGEPVIVEIALARALVSSPKLPIDPLPLAMPLSSWLRWCVRRKDRPHDSCVTSLQAFYGHEP